MIDPRKATSWSSLGLSDSLVKLLPWAKPTTIQRKILATSSSMLVRGVPGLGKSTGALLSMASNASPKSNCLIIVPAPRLVDHYLAEVKRLGLNVEAAGVYRSGDVEQDEKQHQQLGSSNLIVGTPTRLLDYLHWDPSAFGVDNLQSLIVDELEDYPSSREHKKPLEVLLEFIMSRSQPKSIVLSNQTRTESESPRSFSTTLTDISEATPEWQGTTKFFDYNGKSISESALDTLKGNRPKKLPEEKLAKVLKKIWAGPGVVVVPNGVSKLKFEQALKPELLKENRICKEAELSGVPLDTNNLYVIGIDGHTNFEKLQWTLGSRNDKTMFVVLAPY